MRGRRGGTRSKHVSLSPRPAAPLPPEPPGPAPPTRSPGPQCISDSPSSSQPQGSIRKQGWAPDPHTCHVPALDSVPPALSKTQPTEGEMGWGTWGLQGPLFGCAHRRCQPQALAHPPWGRPHLPGPEWLPRPWHTCGGPAPPSRARRGSRSAGPSRDRCPADTRVSAALTELTGPPGCPPPCSSSTSLCDTVNAPHGELLEGCSEGGAARAPPALTQRP